MAKVRKRRENYVTKVHLREVIMRERKFNAKMFDQAAKERSALEMQMSVGFKALDDKINIKVDTVIAMLEKNFKMQSYVSDNFHKRLSILETHLPSE